MLIINVAKTQAQVNFSVSKGFFKAELSRFVFGITSLKSLRLRKLLDQSTLAY